MRITNSFGTLVYEQTTKVRPGDRTWWSLKKREKSCQIIDVAIPDDSRVRVKEDEKVEKYQDLAREVGRMWGGEGKGCTNGDWSSGNSTTKAESQSESNRTGRNLTYTEISTVGKNTEECVRDVKLEMR